MQYQKLTKKEKIEKIVNALNDTIEQYGYFIIDTKDMCVIYGNKFELDHVLKESYINVINENNKVYVRIKAINIRHISPLGFFIP